MWRTLLATGLLACWTSANGWGQPLVLPTVNRSLLDTDGGRERYYVETSGSTWEKGQYGCVRSGGNQIHEGIDIRPLHRDARGEATDAVYCVADSTVVYRNDRPGRSTFGTYLVLQHQVDSLEVYSLYAHLSSINPEVVPGLKLSAGEIVGIMGRTTNISPRIPKNRAHLHFEFALLVNDRYARWHRKTFPKSKNDHGIWNGGNLVGLDPSVLLRESASSPATFNLLEYVRHQQELFRVQVRDTNFSWIKRYVRLVLRNPQADQNGVAAYEIAFDFNGLPFQLVPRSPQEVDSTQKIKLLSVNEEQQRLRGCRHWIAKKQGAWTLTAKGRQWIEQLTF